MPVRLFVGNLPYDATEADLREHFSAAGPVSYISLPTDRETGRPRGFAFIEYNDRSQAEDAINRFNNQVFKGRPIAVSEARAREDRPPGGGFTRPSTPRPALSRSNANAEPDVASPPAPGSKRSRDFGPDASPQSQRNKKKGGSRPERAPKGPMREMVRGQFYGGTDDEDDFDDFDDVVDDFYEDEDDFYDDESVEGSDSENLDGPLKDAPDVDKQ
ncbi:MAG: hypothetical protein IPJ07_26435 [Acidobacteria bacterium]|nr:hypothetical protein [Acidobacteriota bacterium]